MNLLNFTSRRTAALKKELEEKLKQARERKESLLNEKSMNRYNDGLNYFKQHWLLRENTRRKNVELLKNYDQELHENAKVCEIFLKIFQSIFKFKMYFFQSRNVMIGCKEFVKRMK